MLLELKLGHQEGLHDHHAFGVDVATQLGLTLDIGEFTVANMHDAADSRRFAKSARMTRKLDDGKGIDLSYAFTFGFHQNLFKQNFILHAIGEVAFTPFSLGQHLNILFPGKASFTANDAHFTQLLTEPEWT